MPQDIGIPTPIPVGPERRLQEKNLRPGESENVDRPTGPDTRQRESSDRMPGDWTN